MIERNFTLLVVQFSTHEHYENSHSSSARTVTSTAGLSRMRHAFGPIKTTASSAHAADSVSIPSFRDE